MGNVRGKGQGGGGKRLCLGRAVGPDSRQLFASLQAAAPEKENNSATIEGRGAKNSEPETAARPGRAVVAGICPLPEQRAAEQEATAMTPIERSTTTSTQLS